MPGVRAEWTPAPHGPPEPVAWGDPWRPRRRPSGSHQCREGPPPESHKEVGTPTQRKNPKKQGSSPRPLSPLRQPVHSDRFRILPEPGPSCTTACLPCDGNTLQGKGLANRSMVSSGTAPLKGWSVGHSGHRLQTQREGRKVREGALRPSPAQERAGGVTVFGR